METKTKQITEDKVLRQVERLSMVKIRMELVTDGFTGWKTKSN